LLARSLASLLVAAVAGTAAAHAASHETTTLRIRVEGPGVVAYHQRQYCASRCRLRLNTGSEIRLVAEASRGWFFSGWSGGCTGIRPTCTIHPRQVQTVYATFSKPPPTPPAPPPTAPGL
jgi:hypothetical protein